ncbi:hypothetical protein [Bradyrhizobium sp. BTAi1]|uniref:hypothetical protein n=1 Tax=Bradyrhizobium sp. (strain BTAi1 / ATCC BAA-1182) TaxID=288000 RepID=UPI00005DE27D|nr:hypothetical protein [Bradyrhizobium sp. BTAi1]ABQ39768.1 putative exported protein of unknown function [Bradyrhizobium sp. BTAi1]
MTLKTRKLLAAPLAVATISIGSVAGGTNALADDHGHGSGHGFFDHGHGDHFSGGYDHWNGDPHGHGSCWVFGPHGPYNIC